MRQTQVQLEILRVLQGLYRFMRSRGPQIEIRNGVICAVDPETGQCLPFSPETSEPPAKDLETFYLRRLAANCDRLDLADLDRDCPSPEDQRRRVKISDVFTTLHLEGPGRLPEQSAKEAILEPRRGFGDEDAAVRISLRKREKEKGKGKEQEEKRVPIQAAEACDALDRIVVLGRPGGGKSTLVNHLAAGMAKRRMGEEIPESPVSRWETETQALLPAVVVLRRFAAWLPDEKARPAEGLVWRYLEHVLGEWGCESFVQDMKPIFDKQGGAVFFDGLDEVGHGNEDGKRDLILQTIRNFAESFPKCRVVVTCREYAYRDAPGQGRGANGNAVEKAASWRLPESEFPSVGLALFDPEQIRFFTRAWYDATGEWKGWDKKTWESEAEKLHEVILRSKNLLELGQYPLLLALMAQVHGRDGTLPRDRAELYERVVGLLLTHWESRVARDFADECRLELGMVPNLNIPTDKLRRVLEQAALFAHERQEKRDGRGTGCADIDIGDLRETLAKELDGDWNKADEALGYMERRAGLIQANENKTFSFPHRTFQEYLAATAIRKKENFEGCMRECLLRDAEWWREVFLLAAGSCREHPNQIYYLLDAMLPEGPEKSEMNSPNSTLACLAAQAMGETRFVERVSSDTEKTEKKDGRFDRIFLRVRNWLLASMTADGILTAKQRCDAGNALNHIGDPRFDPEWWHLPKDGKFGFVKIPKGPFPMGSDKKRDSNAREDEFPQHTVKLSEYAIGRYPVTVAQYKAFLEDSRKEPDKGCKV